MKRILTALVFLFIGSSVLAQDTTIIQTLTFDSITTRRGWWQFPDETKDYRKVLMYYTLKCDAATTADQYACGEWDYLSYAFLYDHTGDLDSTALSHPQYIFGTENLDTFEYDVNPLHNLFHSYDETMVYDSVINEDSAIFDIGVTLDTAPFGTTAQVVRSQYLWRSSELTASGLAAGGIDRLSVDLSIAGTELEGLTIRLKQTTDTALYNFSEGGFSEVYHFNHNFTGMGWNTFDLTSEFMWDGTSNLIVEYSYEGDGSTEAQSETTAYNSSVSASGNNGYMILDEGNYVQIPLNGIDLGSEVTITFWSNGDSEVQPENSYCFEGVNAAGQRVLNAHLPWSNGNIYWDAGEGSGYDRIYKAATEAEYEGNWVHWAFTKNANTGSMKIYKNGTLWHSGTELNRVIGEVDRFYIGRSAAGSANWHGFMDEFRIWDVELDAQTIADYMNTSIDESHPNYADLIVNYNFDTGYDVTDQSLNSLDAVLFGSPEILTYNSTEVSFNTVSSNLRPNTVFIQGDYVSHLDSTMVTDSVLIPPITWVEFGISGNNVYPINAGSGWAGYGLEFNADGMVVDTVWADESSSIANDTLNYYGEAFEIIDRFEIGRYITPYGIGLSLGPEGFRWIFDVTDYAHLMHDSVDISAGNNQELIDVQFVMIEGDQMAPVEELTRPWGQSGSKSYANLDNNNSLPPVDVNLDPDAEHFKIKTRLTGHGHQSNSGNYPHCCEWKDNTHYFHVDGVQTDEWHIWQTHECAQNPVYPQGGTWPGSREGWCPGDVVKDFEFMLTDDISGNSAELDYSITPVPTNNAVMGSGNYIVGMHFMQYGAASHNLDAEIYDVINPNNWEYYRRTNPMCDDAKLVIRNAGATALTSATITYGVIGGPQLTLDWTGNLSFMEKETVDLPINLPNLEFWWGDGSNRFQATISNPNGLTDEYVDNDKYITHYNAPPNYPAGIVIRYSTNNFNQENQYELLDVNGNVIQARYGNQTSANTDYRDTVQLDPGCYVFKVLDTENDGLSYWAYPEQGNGSVRLRENGGSTLINFESEFGREIAHSFTVGGSASINNSSTDSFFNVYPNPNSGLFDLELSRVDGTSTIEILNSIGSVVMRYQVDARNLHKRRIDLTEEGAGIYFVRYTNGTMQNLKKVVVR
jgi:hypothetical protein